MLAKQQQLLLRRNRSITTSRRREVLSWPQLERAVDEKIEQQKEFCGWWKENVSSNWGGSSAPFRALEKAEELTGITHQQVSKWRRWQ